MNIFISTPLIPIIGGILTLIYHFKNQSTNLLTNVFIILSSILTILMTIFIKEPLILSLPLFITNKYNFELKFTIDNLTIIMLLLINFISLAIHRYATNYLQTDRTQGRFMAQLSILTGTVSFLVISGNLLTAFIGWQFIGLSLYLLLNHYHYDSNANRSAKKKFIINRIGDFSFLLAVVICYYYYGNSDFNLTSKYVPVSSSLNDFYAYQLVALLVFVAIMTKSAQFPFHIWLPDTMQAPTPVSAIMHAGVINAGGFLLTRISPFTYDDMLIGNVIFSVGMITLLCAQFFYFSQSDIKKQLAYSTMGQMGFMIVQCSLGLYTAAIFHLIAHGFYKAFLFLSSGNNIKNHTKENNISVGFLATVLSISPVAVYYIMHANNLNTAKFITFVFIVVTVSNIIANMIFSKNSVKLKLITGLMFILVFSLYIFLVNTMGSLMPEYNYSMDNSFDSYKLIITLFVITLQILIWLLPVYSNYIPQKIVIKIYHLSRNKLFIENFYRKVFLNPYRKIGDVLNDILIKQSKLNIAMIVATLFFIYNGIKSVHIFDRNINIIISLSLFILCLIIANKAKNLRSLNLFLFLSQINMVNIGLFSSNMLNGKIGVFQIINSGLIYIALRVIISAVHTSNKKIIAPHNILNINSLYFAILLFLLIGLPGTSSFICELNVMFSLTSHNLVYLIPTGIGFVLLAIAILHALQEHVFNLKSELLTKTINLNITEYCFITACIVINIFNGINPTLLITKIEYFLG